MGGRVSMGAILLLAMSWASGPDALARDASRGASVTVEIPPDGVIQELRLQDGSRLYGRALEIDGEQVVFRTLSGLQLVLTRDEIADLRRVHGYVRGGISGPRIRTGRVSSLARPRVRCLGDEATWASTSSSCHSCRWG